MAAASQDRSQLITDLCDSWVGAATGGGGLQLGADTEKFRLRNNGIQAHDLDYAELRATCIGLTKVLLHPGLNTVIDWDHQALWAWCAEVLAGSRAQFFSANERELKDLLGIACRAALAGVSKPGPGGFEEARRRSEMMEPNAQQLVMRAHQVLVYLAFPLLEGILRKVGRNYVDYDGRVLAPFQGRTRQYKVGDRCNSLADLLGLLYSAVASADLKRALTEFRQHLSRLVAGTDPFDTIFEWRNSSLHGSTSLPTIGGTIFTMALLIALDQVEATYQALRSDTLQQVRWELQTGGITHHRSPWSYYPPWV